MPQPKGNDSNSRSDFAPCWKLPRHPCIKLERHHQRRPSLLHRLITKPPNLAGRRKPSSPRRLPRWNRFTSITSRSQPPQCLISMLRICRSTSRPTALLIRPDRLAHSIPSRWWRQRAALNCLPTLRVSRPLSGRTGQRASATSCPSRAAAATSKICRAAHRPVARRANSPPSTGIIT